MAGLSSRMRMMRALLPKIEDPEQRAGLLLAMEDEERSLPRERRGSGFTGSPVGEIERAPWRGEFELPGNYERDQAIANSLAEDAALREGLSHSYSYKAGQPIPAQFSRHGLAWDALSSSMMKDEDEVYLSAPPDMDRMLLQRQNAGMWDPSGDRAFTKSEVEQIQRMLAKGGSGMRGMVERRYKDRPFFYEIFGGQ